MASTRTLHDSRLELLKCRLLLWGLDEIPDSSLHAWILREAEVAGTHHFVHPA